MIDPRTITNFSRSEYELQEFLLFCVVVAGKSSEQQSRKLEIFLAPHTHLPFEKINYLESVFLTYCDTAGKSPAEMDLEIWKERQKQSAAAKELKATA